MILLLAAGIFWIIMSGKSSRNEGMGRVAQKTLPLLTDQQGQTVTRPQNLLTQKIDNPAIEEKIPAKEIPTDRQSAELEKQISPITIAADEKDPLKKIQTVPIEIKKESPEKVQSKDKEIPVQEQPAQAEQLGSVNAELIRLRGFMEKRNLLAADRLADALLLSGTESRIFPLLGNVKFFLSKFAAAEKLWLKSLQANHLVTLELMHMHDVSGDFCLGQLKFKKKIIMFSSDARGDHSFALQAGNVKAIIMGNDQKFTITATINGQEMNESFMLDIKNNKLEKEKLLVDFLNKYVL
jgi:hypothetical protein